MWDQTTHQGSGLDPVRATFLIPEDAAEMLDLSSLFYYLYSRDDPPSSTLSPTSSPLLLSGKTVYFTCLSCTLLLLFLLTCLFGFSFSICMQSRKPEVLLVQEEVRKKEAKTKGTDKV